MKLTNKSEKFENAKAKARQISSRSGSFVSQWIIGIKDWFLFLHRRRVDTRFSILPTRLRMVEAFAVIASMILLMVVSVDRVYLAAIQRKGADVGGFFSRITDLGKSNWILILTGLALIGFSIYSSKRYRGAARMVWHRGVLSFYYLFTTVAFSGLIVLLLKPIFARARPDYVPRGLVWYSDHFAHAYRFGSFPSGHATTAGAMAMGLALLFPKGRVFFLLAGAWLAVSRTAIGVHFPSDAFAGFLLGAGFSYYYARGFARKRSLFGFSESGGLVLRGERSVSQAADALAVTDKPLAKLTETSAPKRRKTRSATISRKAKTTGTKTTGTKTTKAKAASANSKSRAKPKGEKK